MHNTLDVRMWSEKEKQSRQSFSAQHSVVNPVVSRSTSARLWNGVLGYIFCFSCVAFRPQIRPPSVTGHFGALLWVHSCTVLVCIEVEPCSTYQEPVISANNMKPTGRVWTENTHAKYETHWLLSLWYFKCEGGYKLNNPPRLLYLQIIMRGRQYIISSTSSDSGGVILDFTSFIATQFTNASI